MKATYAAAGLRAIAVAIAIAAVIDPAMASRGASRPRVAVITQEPGSPAADRIRARLLDTLGAAHDVVPQLTSDAAAAIVIGDRYPEEPVPANVGVATVTTTADATPAVRIVSLETPRAVPAGTAVRIDAELEASGVAGRSTDLVVNSGGLEVGRAAHTWTSDGRWRATVDVVPVGEPPWLLSAEIGDAQRSQPGALAHAVVALRREPLAVQIYEPRPSWAATFVRRALEADPRFRVESLSLTSRGIAARTPGGISLEQAQLEAFDVIVAGGLDRLSAADVRALDRFMRERGGAVALLPDARVSGGAARDLLTLETIERLLERPERLSMAYGAAPIEASELLLLRAPAASLGDVVATASDGSPVIASMPRGRGRLFVSGAMDAWRQRAAPDEGFDRFWQATIAGLALGTAPLVDVTISPPLLTPLQHAEVRVRARRGAGAAVAASIGGQPIRLWPEPEGGAYRGAFVASATPGLMPLEVTVADTRPYTTGLDVVVQPGIRMPMRVRPPLSLLASSHRGIDVTPDRVGELERFVRQTVTAADEAGVRRPMRSTWWLVPFVAALSAEWAMRRRRGLR